MEGQKETNSDLTMSTVHCLYSGRKNGIRLTAKIKDLLRSYFISNVVPCDREALSFYPSVQNGHPTKEVTRAKY